MHDGEGVDGGMVGWAHEADIIKAGSGFPIPSLAFALPLKFFECFNLYAKDKIEPHNRKPRAER